MTTMLKLKGIFTLLFSISLIINLSGQNPVFEIKYQLDIFQKKTNPDLKEVAIPNNLPNIRSMPYTISLNNNNSFTTTINAAKSDFYDFEEEMITHYSDDSIFSKIPIYHKIDFQAAEYSNRIFLTEMLEKSGINNEEIFGTFANLESIFGFEVAENKIRDSILTHQNKDTLIYTFNNYDLAKVHFSKNKLPKEFQNSFLKFMTYQLELHPSIIEKISSNEFIPDYFEIIILNSGVETKKKFQL